MDLDGDAGPRRALARRYLDSAETVAADRAAGPGLSARSLARWLAGVALPPAARAYWQRQQRLNVELVRGLRAAAAPPAGTGPPEPMSRGLSDRAEPAVGEAAERQGAWNRAACDLVEAACRGGLEPGTARRMLGTMRDNLPVAATSAPAPNRRLRLALDRQLAFDWLFLKAAGTLLGEWREPSGQAEYERWLAATGQGAEPARAAAPPGLEQAGLLVSVVVPVYETPPAFLRACIESVLAQSYGRWELCLADDGSRAPHVAAVLAEYAAGDERVRVATLDRNQGIAAATNAALSLATGDLVAFLDHDDLLAPHALDAVVAHVEASPGTDLVYSDEDRVDASGRRTLPFMKPDWSPDLLRSCNYLRHLVVARRRLVEAVGGCRSAFDGAQDFDLALRLAEKAESVGHVPEVLYHWRDTDSSLARGVGSKPYAVEAGRRAVVEHLARGGEEAEVTRTPTHFRVRYPVPGSLRATIVVVAGPGSRQFEQLVGSIVELTAYDHYGVVVVGTEPVAGSAGRVRGVPWTEPHRLWAMRNHGARAGEGDILVFLDEDLVVRDPGWLEELVAQAGRPAVGVVGAKVLHPDSTVDEAGLVRDADGTWGSPFSGFDDADHWTPFGSMSWPRNLLAVPASAMAVDRSLFESVGGFDDAEGEAVRPDVGLCRRALDHGRRVLYSPEAVLHRVGAGGGHSESGPPPASSPAPDPFFNPHLTLAAGPAPLPLWRVEHGPGQLPLL